MLITSRLVDAEVQIQVVSFSVLQGKLMYALLLIAVVYSDSPSCECMQADQR